MQVTLLFFEATALLRELLPWSHAYTVRPLSFLGFLTPPLQVKLPNLLVTLSGSFWYPFLLWAIVSIVVPCLFAYFYNLDSRNLELRQYFHCVHCFGIDPFIFNIARYFG